MFKFTLWDVLPVFAWLALPYAGTSLVGVAALLLAFRPTRRWVVARWLAYGFLALTGLLVACAFPMLRMVWEEHERHAAFDAATHHLTEPLKLGGIVFPAGSTVHVGEDGRAEFGTLASPTLVEGVFLVGGFRLASDYGHDLPDIAEGTLARPADIHGIPCGPGAVRSQAETTRCVLGRDYGFTGHFLAAGTMLEVYRSPLGDAPMLRFGTLARPELLYDVLWPAGAIIGQVNNPPGVMAHGSGPDSVLQQVCLPSGLSATITGATLHGFLAYDIQQDRRSVSPVCNILPDGQVGEDGYAQVGTSRYRWGDRATAGAAWQWTDPVQGRPP